MATLEDLERRIEVLERDTATDYLESAAMTARLMGWQQRAEAAEARIAAALAACEYPVSHVSSVVLAGEVRAALNGETL